MSAFHVFVDGPTESSPDAIPQLADAMSRRYGLPAADLASRLAKGRFRVKANVDRATADAYVRDLGAIGARVVIEPAVATPATGLAAAGTTASAQGPTVSSGLAAAGAMPAARTSSPSLPPANAPRASTPSLPPATQAPPRSAELSSGLAAAFSGEVPLDLGALGQGDLALASVDGDDRQPHDAAMLPASIGPAVASAPRPAAPATPAPTDRFAPPQAADEAVLSFAIDEAPPAASSQPITPVLRPRVASAAPPVVAARSSRPMSPRVRLLAGVALAVLLGFVPAHFVAAAQEGAYAEIDATVRTFQAQPGVAEADVDAFRQAATDRKKRQRQKIALTGLLVWAAAAGAISYAWFRHVAPERG